eukprot:gene914-1776_t
MGCGQSRFSGKALRLQERPTVVANHEYLEKLLMPKTQISVPLSNEHTSMQKQETMSLKNRESYNYDKGDDRNGQFSPKVIHSPKYNFNMGIVEGANHDHNYINQIPDIELSENSKTMAFEALRNIQNLAISTRHKHSESLSIYVIDGLYSVIENLRKKNPRFLLQILDLVQETRILVCTHVKIDTIESDFSTLSKYPMPDLWLPRTVSLDPLCWSDWGTINELGITNDIMNKIGITFECWFKISKKNKIINTIESIETKNETDAIENHNGVFLLLSADRIPLSTSEDAEEEDEEVEVEVEVEVEGNFHSPRSSGKKKTKAKKQQQQHLEQQRVIEPILAVVNGQIVVTIQNMKHRSNLPHKNQSTTSTTTSTTSQPQQQEEPSSYSNKAEIDDIDNDVDSDPVIHCISPGIWRHVALSCVNNHVKVYLDGILIIDEIGSFITSNDNNSNNNNNSSVSGNTYSSWGDKRLYFGSIPLHKDEFRKIELYLSSRLPKFNIISPKSLNGDNMMMQEFKNVEVNDEVEVEVAKTPEISTTLLSTGRSPKSSGTFDIPSSSSSSSQQLLHLSSSSSKLQQQSNSQGTGNSNGNNGNGSQRQGQGEFCEARLWLRAMETHEIKGNSMRPISPSDAVLTSGLRLSWLPIGSKTSTSTSSSSSNGNVIGQGHNPSAMGSGRGSVLGLGLGLQGSLFFDTWSRTPLLDRRGMTSQRTYSSSIVDNRWPCNLPPVFLIPHDSNGIAVHKERYIIPNFLCEREELWDRKELETAKTQPVLVRLKPNPIAYHAQMVMKTLLTRNEIIKTSALKAMWNPRVVRLNPDQKSYIGTSDNLCMTSSEGFTIEFWVRFPSYCYNNNDSDNDIDIDNDINGNSNRDRNGTMAGNGVGTTVSLVIGPPSYSPEVIGETLHIRVSRSMVSMSFGGDDISLRYETVIPGNTWIHMAFVYRNGTKRILLHGHLVAEAPSGPLRGSCIMYLGVLNNAINNRNNNDNNNDNNGSGVDTGGSTTTSKSKTDSMIDICEFRLWSRGLTRSEVRSQREKTLSPLKIIKGRSTSTSTSTPGNVVDGSGGGGDTGGLALRLSWFPLRRGGTSSQTVWGHTYRTLALSGPGPMTTTLDGDGNAMTGTGTSTSPSRFRTPPSSPLRCSSNNIRVRSMNIDELTRTGAISTLPCATLFWDRMLWKDCGRVVCTQTGEFTSLNTSRVHYNGVPAIFTVTKDKSSETFRRIVALVDDWSDAFDLEFIPFQFARSFTLVIPPYFTKFKSQNTVYAQAMLLTPDPSPSTSPPPMDIWIPRIILLSPSYTSEHSDYYQTNGLRLNNYNTSILCDDDNALIERNNEMLVNMNMSSCKSSSIDVDYSLTMDDLGLLKEDHTLSAFTVEVWLKILPVTIESPEEQLILSHEDSSSSFSSSTSTSASSITYSILRLGLTEGKPFISFKRIIPSESASSSSQSQGQDIVVMSSKALTPHTWTHIAFISKSNGVLSIAIDGVIESTGFSANVKIRNNIPLHVFYKLSLEHIITSICELKVWGYAKTIEDIASNLSNTIIASNSTSFSDSKTPLLSWFPLKQFNTLFWNSVQKRPCGICSSRLSLMVTRRPHLLPSRISERIGCLPIQQYLDDTNDSFELSLASCLKLYIGSSNIQISDYPNILESASLDEIV